jgi:hypothetical protein
MAELITFATFLDTDCTNMDIPMAITREDFIVAGMDALTTSLTSTSASTSSGPPTPSTTVPPTPTHSQSKPPNDGLMIGGIAGGAGVVITCFILAIVWVIFGLRKTEPAQAIDLDMESASCIAELKSKSVSRSTVSQASSRIKSLLSGLVRLRA